MRNLTKPAVLVVASTSLLLLTACSGAQAPGDQKVLSGLTVPTTTTGGVTGSSSGSSGFSATYAPLAVAPGGTETISPVGGTGPYVYKLVSGSGTLNGSTYVVPAATASTTTPDVAVIVVADAIGETTTVTFNDGAALQQMVTMNPITYVQVPGGTAVKRNCDMEAIQKSGTDAGTVINYLFCQNLGRTATNSEISYYYNQVYDEDNSMSPYGVLNEIQNLPEFLNLYNVSAMSMSNWVTFEYQILTLVTPTSSQVTMYVNQAASPNFLFGSLPGKSFTVFSNILNTSDYQNANPLVVQAEAQWTQAIDEE